MQIIQNDEQQQKNVAIMNGFTNGEVKTARYRPGTVARNEIRRYQLPNQRESPIVNRLDAMQLGRRIRGERA